MRTERAKEKDGVEWKNVTETQSEKGLEIKLRYKRKRQIVYALERHLYDLSVRKLVKLNSGAA